MATIAFKRSESALEAEESVTELRQELVATLSEIPVVGPILSFGADLLLPSVPESSGEIIAGMIGGVGGNAARVGKRLLNRTGTGA